MVTYVFKRIFDCFVKCRPGPDDVLVVGFEDVIVECSGYRFECPLPGPNFTHPWSPIEVYYHTIVSTQMSPSTQTANPSISNFTAIFDAASHEYKALTKQDLATHPFAAAL